MRLVATFFLAAVVVTVSGAGVQAQCQRGGQRGAPPPTSSFGAPAGVAPVGVDPRLAGQQAAFQQQMQVALRRQAAIQQLWLQRQLAQVRADQERLARKRASATDRRAAVLARRELTRAENLQRLSASPGRERSGNGTRLVSLPR